MSNTVGTSMEEKKINDAMRLFEALSGVDEELLIGCETEATDKVVPRHPSKQRILKFVHGGAALAAAVCVLAVGIVVWQMNGPMFLSKNNTASSADCAAGYEYPEAPAEMQEAAVALPEAAPEEEKAEVYEAQSEEHKESGAVEETTTEAVATKSQEKESNIGNSKIENLEQSIQESVMDSGIGKDSRAEITEAGARQLAVLGAYVPTVLPEGYTWESGRLSLATENEAESVFLVWTKGMDSIELAIASVDTAQMQLTDITAEETYNVHLYDIPYAQTIPEEYRDTFDSPVFAAEDLSLELIEMRMKSLADAGDTDTPRGNFSVLYENGVLVRFGGQGTAQEIWEMFQSIDL